ncbi:MAG: transposase-like protein [Algoriphagus sp.]|jgi:transposase-like protein
MKMHVDTMLESEIDSFLKEEHSSGKTNKQNDRTKKRISNQLGTKDISTPKDHNNHFKPEHLARESQS